MKIENRIKKTNLRIGILNKRINNDSKRICKLNERQCNMEVILRKHTELCTFKIKLLMDKIKYLEEKVNENYQKPFIENQKTLEDFGLQITR